MRDLSSLSQRRMLEPADDHDHFRVLATEVKLL